MPLQWGGSMFPGREGPIRAGTSGTLPCAARIAGEAGLLPTGNAKPPAGTRIWEVGRSVGPHAPGELQLVGVERRATSALGRRRESSTWSLSQCSQLPVRCQPCHTPRRADSYRQGGTQSSSRSMKRFHPWRTGRVRCLVLRVLELRIHRNPPILREFFSNAP